MSSVLSFPDRKFGVTQGYVMDKFEALISMDQATILRFWDRWGLKYEREGQAFWNKVYRLALAMPEIDSETVARLKEKAEA